MAKVLREVSFNALHILGSLGTTDLTPLQAMYAAAPTMGIADGVDEVHKATVARRVLKGYRPHEGYWPTEYFPAKREEAWKKMQPRPRRPPRPARQSAESYKKYFIRLLEGGGPQSLSVRNLATEAGTSTMAVYTHFGGMTGVIDAIAVEVFARFTKALTEVEQTDDPVTDFFVMVNAYRDFALANPQRYSLIFGTRSPETLTGYRTDLTVTGNPTDQADRAASFEALRNVVRRMIAGGRIRDDDEPAIAGRLWSLTHGGVMLEMAGFFGHEGHGSPRSLRRSPSTSSWEWATIARERTSHWPPRRPASDRPAKRNSSSEMSSRGLLEFRFAKDRATPHRASGTQPSRRSR